jgi:sporulation protein YlmC with PRC-barrel domain
MRLSVLVVGHDRKRGGQNMKRSTVAGPVVACVCLCFAGPLAAAELPATGVVAKPSPSETTASTTKPAETCLNDLSAFDRQMEKDGYWPGRAGNGYPIMDGSPPAAATGYRGARLSYELRTLVASASILAQRGHQQPCEDVLSTTRDVYKIYLAYMQSEGVQTVASRQQQQIAAAQPVTVNAAAFRSAELIGTDVRNVKNEALGSVHDLLFSPKSGTIAYLVIGRGGFFGIDEKYVPIPWDDFKITPNMSLLVLDISKDVVDDAPQVKDDQLVTSGQFDQESQKVDAYWKAHLGNN